MKKLICIFPILLLLLLLITVSGCVSTQTPARSSLPPGLATSDSSPFNVEGVYVKANDTIVLMVPPFMDSLGTSYPASTDYANLAKKPAPGRWVAIYFFAESGDSLRWHRYDGIISATNPLTVKSIEAVNVAEYRQLPSEELWCAAVFTNHRNPAKQEFIGWIQYGQVINLELYFGSVTIVKPCWQLAGTVSK